MNFLIFEDVNGKQTFNWENELVNLPKDSITFTYYNQEAIDEFGNTENIQYRIGVPVKIVMVDMNFELSPIEFNKCKEENNFDKIYSLYKKDDIPPRLSPINANVRLVKDQQELQEKFSIELISKSHSKMR